MVIFVEWAHSVLQEAFRLFEIVLIVSCQLVLVSDEPRAI
jgi:hypothetical protein